ncbi:hypothetical protein [Pseudomonas sp. ZS1P83]
MLFYIEGNGLVFSFLQVIDRKAQLRVDGRFWKSIIRPTSGAVETENSLVNKELRSFRQRVVSGHRSPEEVERVGLFGSFNGSIFSVESGVKEVLTAASNAVEFASR